METVWQLAANAGGVVLLAVLVVFLQSKQQEKMLANEQQRAIEEREDKLRLATVLEANTKAITSLALIIEELRRGRSAP